TRTQIHKGHTNISTHSDAPWHTKVHTNIFTHSHAPWQTKVHTHTHTHPYTYTLTLLHTSLDRDSDAALPACLGLKHCQGTEQQKKAFAFQGASLLKGFQTT